MRHAIGLYVRPNSRAVGIRARFSGTAVVHDIAVMNRFSRTGMLLWPEACAVASTAALHTLPLPNHSLTIPDPLSYERRATCERQPLALQPSKCCPTSVSPCSISIEQTPKTRVAECDPGVLQRSSLPICVFRPSIRRHPGQVLALWHGRRSRDGQDAFSDRSGSARDMRATAGLRG